MTKLIFDKKQLDALNLTIGLEILAKDYDFLPAYEGNDGIAVTLKDHEGSTMSLEFKDSKAQFAFRFADKNLFFRLLSVLLQAVEEGKAELSLTESTHFTTRGTKIDLSQGNMALHVSVLKDLFRHMAFMGLNMCMMYMEDNYEVPEEPYFGHMRSRYTYEELKELDDYADLFGIEIIPAIQTLAHQETVMQWDVYKPIRENRRCMLPGEPKTYEFIRHILAASSKPFRSKRVFLGMDEAAFLGHGTYFRRHGMVPSHDIFMMHLAEVCKITEEMGIIPMVSCDNYRLTVPRDKREFGSASMYLEDAHPDLQIMFWGYSPNPAEWHIPRILANRKKDHGGIFNNTTWNWLGYGPNWNMTLANMPSMIACRKTNVYEALNSIWMIGFDTDFRVNYLGLQIFAEYCFYEEPDLDHIKARFEFCTDGSFDALWHLQLLNEIPGVPEGNLSKRPSSAPEFLMWQDPMCGMFDKDIEPYNVNAHFEKLEKEIAVFAEKAKGTSYENVMEFFRRVASALSLKSDLGNNIRKAYLAGDRAEMLRLADEVIPETARRISALQEQARLLWHELGKPLGWEVYDLHYGGALMRLSSASKDLHDYLEGRREKLEDLEAPRLSYYRANMGYAGTIPAWTDKWGRMCSASLVAPEYWFALPKDDVAPEGV